MQTRKIVLDVIIGLFVLLFLYTAASKLFAYDNTFLQMSKSPIITDFAHILVWLVPLIEFVISALLLINRTVLLGLYLSFAMMCLFTAYIYAILNYSDVVPCSCGGGIENMTWEQHLAFNIVLDVLGMVGIVLESKKIKHQYPQGISKNIHWPIESGEAENL
ncbi:MauE/DoxX family redox-associated membrane protein [Parapedobacter sp. 2B3]|uniref:MauE/DoxX family redox-associated membrane protein n=1 Tax=Parapedobacter sp. 2B3 TaxID=3342381 RepID=UPI0035B5AD7C